MNMCTDSNTHNNNNNTNSTSNNSNKTNTDNDNTTTFSFYVDSSEYIFLRPVRAGPILSVCPVWAGPIFFRNIPIVFVPVHTGTYLYVAVRQVCCFFCDHIPFFICFPMRIFICFGVLPHIMCCFFMDMCRCRWVCVFTKSVVLLCVHIHLLLFRYIYTFTVFPMHIFIYCFLNDLIYCIMFI